LWVIFALLDPDPDPEYGSGSRSTDPIEYGSNTDPDPQPWAKALHKIQGEEQAYLSSLLPIIAALIMMLHDFDNKPLVYCRPLVEALQNGMKKRFGKLMDDLVVLLAAAFHPQFCLFWLEHSSTMIWRVKKEMERAVEK
jgi:hypothetical protein